MARSEITAWVVLTPPVLDKNGDFEIVEVKGEISCNGGLFYLSHEFRIQSRFSKVLYSPYRDSFRSNIGIYFFLTAEQAQAALERWLQICISNAEENLELSEKRLAALLSRKSKEG